MCEEDGAAKLLETERLTALHAATGRPLRLPRPLNLREDPKSKSLNGGSYKVPLVA